MTVNPSIDPARMLEEQLDQASPDLLRQMLQVFINTLLGVEADAVCGAAYGQSSPERVNSRNGYRHRDFAPAPSTSRSRSCARAPTSPSGSSSAAPEPRKPSPPWSRPATSWVCRRGG